MAHPDDDQIVSGHLEEGTVHAWLDGQLLADEAARVESHVAACATCQAQVAEARGFIAASSRILTALDGVPARVVPERRRVQLWHVRAAAGCSS
jgi:anti-sigma factor RsiW